MFVTPPIEPIEFESLKILHLSLSPLSLRTIGLFIHIATSIFFASAITKITNKGKPMVLIGFFVFLISPWANILSTFYLLQNIFLLLFVISMKYKKRILTILICILAIFYLNNTYSKDYSFLKTISPKNLGAEINEDQRINFLSVGKRFILPYPIRVFTYNKPTLALNKIISQFVSFFDFEQLIAPDKAYEIIKLSGISPKGNLPLFYIWEVPLIIFGIYRFSRFNPIKKYIGLSFLLCLIPFLLFEKKLLAQTAFLTIVPILMTECLGIYTLAKRLNKIFLAGVAIVVLSFAINFYDILFFKPLSYQTPQPYLYREVARWIYKNYDPTKNYIVTNRFGPTDLIIPFYLGKNYKNISFKSFDLRKDKPDEKTIYIGLAGEYVKPGKDLETKGPPSEMQIVGKIIGEDEPVFEYGSNLWICYHE